MWWTQDRCVEVGWGVVCWGRIEQVYRYMGEGAVMYAVCGMWLPQVNVVWS